MAGFTTYTQQKVLDHATGKAAWTMPANVHVALFTVAPTDAGGGTEAAYTGYGRVQTTAASWNSASGTATSNSATVTFGQCTAGTANVVAFGAYDAASGGNLLWWGTCSLSISTGITPSFAGGAPGALVVTLD